MGVTFDFRDLVAFFLALARASGWIVMVPPFTNRQSVPPVVTVATAVGLSLLVTPLVPVATLPTQVAGLLASLVVQVVTGAAMGFVVALLLTTVSAAGSFVDLMGGLNLPPSIDPLGLDQSPAMGLFYEQVAMVLLFSSGGYLVMVDGFARSFQMPGFTLASTSLLSRILVVDLATFFLSALEMAAPLLAVLFATQIVLALLTKAAPQINVWLLGMPLQIFISLILVGLGIAVVPGSLATLVMRGFHDATGFLTGR